jgi:hypothetical protein
MAKHATKAKAEEKKSRSHGLDFSESGCHQALVDRREKQDESST